MKSEKGLAPILILVGILVVIGIATGAYYFGKSQTPKPQPQITVTPAPSAKVDETANWKTYTSSAYKFQFGYPSDWNFVTPSLEGKYPDNKTLLQHNLNNDLDFKNKALLGKQKNVISVTVRVWNGDLTSYDKFFQNQSIKPLLTKSINQINWTVREYINTSNLSIKEFSTVKDNILYVFTISPTDSTLADKADQILSTFRFD